MQYMLKQRPCQMVGHCTCCPNTTLRHFPCGILAILDTGYSIPLFPIYSGPLLYSILCEIYFFTLLIMIYEKFNTNNDQNNRVSGPLPEPNIMTANSAACMRFNSNRPINILINKMTKSNTLFDLWFDTAILGCLSLYYWPFLAIAQIDSVFDIYKTTICNK